MRLRACVHVLCEVACGSLTRAPFQNKHTPARAPQKKIKPKMNGTKSMVGHCLGAAAGIEAVAVLKAIETGEWRGGGSEGEGGGEGEGERGRGGRERGLLASGMCLC